jgi:hypothetical protein
MKDGNDSKKRQEISGVSILESLIATAIVGIGFIAIFQMISFSSNSMSTSAERTKVNYIVGSIAEDIIAASNTEVGGLTLAESIVSRAGAGNNAITKTDCETINPRGFNAADNNDNKTSKWDYMLSSTSNVGGGDEGVASNLRCQANDRKIINTYEICSVGCENVNATVFDPLLIGRVVVTVNNGRKRQVLYFATSE